jgi:hypothetical protein
VPTYQIQNGKLAKISPRVKPFCSRGFQRKAAKTQRRKENLFLLPIHNRMGTLAFLLRRFPQVSQAQFGDRELIGFKTSPN